MVIHSANFLKSSTELSQCPEVNLPEYAFIGRSNVGKSSLINYLTNHKKLAKTSGTPGKTQTINHFLINENWLLADLPGYGYAKVSKSLRSDFDVMIRSYLKERENLVCVFVLIDSRHEALKPDIDFLNWIGENEIPFSIVFTKIDKLSSSELNKQITSYKKTLLNYWESLPKTFNSSSVTKNGGNEILHFIDETNKLIQLKK
jgi:GTP-binding protein